MAKATLVPYANWEDWGQPISPEKTVVVNWDSGNRSNYRVGYQDQYDLIIVDNAQIGK